MAGSPNRPLAKTGASLDRLVPEEGDGLAEKDRTEDRPTRPGEDEYHQAVVQRSEGAVREDAEVL